MAMSKGRNSSTQAGALLKVEPELHEQLNTFLDTAQYSLLFGHLPVPYAWGFNPVDC
jgi:hypothetical protein